MNEVNKQIKDEQSMNHQQLLQQLQLAEPLQEAQGQILWQQRGWNVFNNLSRWMQSIYRAGGYVEVNSPALFNQNLFEQSGHLAKFKDKMFCVEQMALKPMNCPGHCAYYKKRPHSYKELPLRIAEIGKVYRKEQSGALNGLLRMSSFSIDDAHIFAVEGEEQPEIIKCLKEAQLIYSQLGMSIEAELSLRPADFLGEAEVWDKAEAELEQALQVVGLPYSISEGEGAFYGPKIDLHVKDSLGRAWQMGSVQLDYQLPQRFQLQYQGRDNRNHAKMVIVHRALLGSLERFLGILLEHSQGRLPLYLDSEAVILPVSDQPHLLSYAESVAQQIEQCLIDADGSLGQRIRVHSKQKRPLLLIIGESEVADKSINIRWQEASVSSKKPSQMKVSQAAQLIAEERKFHPAQV